MQSGIRTYYFLGADSSSGYYSLFGSLLSSASCETQYIIKGGHAYGKGVFLEKLVELITAEGFDVECYRGALDSELLEGIFIPELKTVFLDGEMPHAVNAQYPGAVETYVDLGVAYDSAALKKSRSEIVALTNEIESLRIKLTRYLSAAGEIRGNIYSTVRNRKTVETVKGRAARNAARELKKSTGAGSVSYRFLSTSSGKESAPDFSAITANCQRLCVLDNDFGLSTELLSVIISRAAALGHAAIAFLDPLEPERLEHLVLPELSLAYISKASRQELDCGEFKHFRLDALPREGLSQAEKVRIKADRKLLSALINRAGETREEIKQHSRRLGELYTPFLNTAAVTGLAEEFGRIVE